jgi:hypothetical protein
MHLANNDANKNAGKGNAHIPYKFSIMAIKTRI